MPKLTVVLPQGPGETEGIKEFSGAVEYKTHDMGHLTIEVSHTRLGQIDVATFAPGAWLRVVREG